MSTATSDRTYEAFQTLLEAQTGIVLRDDQRVFRTHRLSKRMARRQASSLKAYLHLVRTESSEMKQFINALTTNVTHFFREPQHFDRLKRHAQSHQSDEYRVWCGAAATGPEVWSIAMVLHDVRHTHWRLLATDIDTHALTQAKIGIYPHQEVKQVAPDYQNRFLQRRSGDVYAVVESLRPQVVFAPLNLLEPWPMKKSFQVIFIRNVMFYFGEKNRQSIVRRATSLLAPGGLLFVGHAEALACGNKQLESVCTSVYRRTSQR